MPPKKQGPKPRHTILLIQEGSTQTRTYYDYENVPAATEGLWKTLHDMRLGVCKLYEGKLKKQNPNKKNIVYNVTDLFSWIDQLTDLSCLVYVLHIYIGIDNVRFNPENNSYFPHDKEWIKARALDNLKKQMNQNE